MVSVGANFRSFKNWGKTHVTENSPFYNSRVSSSEASGTWMLLHSRQHHPSPGIISSSETQTLSP